MLVDWELNKDNKHFEMRVNRLIRALKGENVNVLDFKLGKHLQHYSVTDVISNF